MNINIPITGLILVITHHVGIAQKQNINLTIEEAVKKKKKNNLQVLTAKKEVAAAKGYAITTLDIKNPRISGELAEIPAGSGLGAYHERTIKISQSIDFPTNYFHKKKLGDLNVERARIHLRKTKLEVRTELKKAYYRLLAMQEKLSLVKKHIGLAEDFLKKARLRHQTGKVPVLEVSRARLALAEVENELSAVRADYLSARENLDALLALPDDQSAGAADSLTYKLLNLDVISLKQQALQDHPSLLVVELTHKMARQDMKLARGGYLPNIKGSWFSQKIGGEPFRGLEVGLSIPLWAPVNQRGQVMQSKGQLQAAQYRLEDEKIMLIANINSAYSQYNAAGEQVEKYLDNLLEQAQDVYRMTFRSYEEGKVGYLKVLDAQESLIAVNKKYIDALANYKIRVAELEQATNQRLEQ